MTPSLSNPQTKTILVQRKALEQGECKKSAHKLNLKNNKYSGV
jgi:hypothetical protein